MKEFIKNYIGLIKVAYKEKGILFSVWAAMSGWFVCLFFWGKELK